MRVLVLATSGPKAAIGLWTGAPPLREVALGQGQDRGRGVAPAIASLLEGANLAPGDVEAVAVDVGPGSFTGTRVGVATAKGLEVAVGARLVGVSSLDALAHAAGETSTPILALRDARSGEAYFALYEPSEPLETGTRPGPGGDARPRRIEGPSRGTGRAIADALAARSVARVLACGEDAERLAVTLALGPLLAGVRTPFVSVADVLAVGLPRLERGEADDADALAPLYLQPSTPERRLAEGTGRA